MGNYKPLSNYKPPLCKIKRKQTKILIEQFPRMQGIPGMHQEARRSSPEELRKGPYVRQKVVTLTLLKKNYELFSGLGDFTKIPALLYKSLEKFTSSTI